MNQPWEPEITVQIGQAARMITAQFPQLQPVHITNFGEGFDNSVFLVNNQYVFRFPRKEMAVSLLAAECRILPLLAPNLPIPIPHPHFLGRPEAGYPWPFAGYELLPGKTPFRLTEEQRIMSAKPFALFLKKLHDFPIGKAEQLQIPYDQLDRMNLVKRKPMLETSIESAKRNGLLDSGTEEKLHDFLSTIHASFKDETRTLVHGDLHMKNFLVDDKGKISAVIDWGDTHIGHPVIDLSIVYSFLPPAGRNEFFQWYGDVLPEWKIAARFKAIHSLIMLLSYANDQEDLKLVNECCASLRIALN